MWIRLGQITGVTSHVLASGGRATLSMFFDQALGFVIEERVTTGVETIPKENTMHTTT